MYNLVNLNHNSMAVHLTRSACEEFQGAEYPMQWMMMICCGKAVKNMGIL